MKGNPTLRLAARLHKPSGGWDVAIRYGAAYACTLIAIAAAQLVLPNEIVWLLTGLTLLGLPLSLWLRHDDQRDGDALLHRPVINFVVFLFTIALIAYVLAANAPRLFSSNFSEFLRQASAGQIISLLMEIFLIFAACRCLAIITDKDAVLCTVPSFSVMLLLIVVHKGPEVVGYFFVWAVLSAILVALDHRSEVRQSTLAYVPAPLPGQAVKLSARSLASVLSFSLICAFGLSYTLTGRDPEQQGVTEAWVTTLASRLTQLALDLPDVSVNSGPERQIDYGSGPALPTRTLIWKVETRRVEDGRVLQPHYFRMFTLATYNGQTWAQTTGAGRIVERDVLSEERWPLQARPDLPSWANDITSARFEEFQRRRRRGYDVRRFEAPRAIHNFGAPRQSVRLIISAQVANSGYVPALPSITALRLPDSRPNSVRIRSDNSVDIGVLMRAQSAEIISELSPQREYGSSGTPPENREKRPNPLARLTAAERRMYLQLPPTLPARVRQWAKQAISGSDDPRWSDYRRARSLMIALQQGAVYTLRPPTIPKNRDAVDFFLFESRRGYCTYFAGALTVACRAVNIPARVVSGFTNPEWTSGGTRADLRESNVHAWTEVWVPNWGWAAIDATPPDDRGNNAPSWIDNWQDIFGATQTSLVLWLKAHMPWVIAGVSGLASMSLLFLSSWRREDLRRFLATHGLQRSNQHRDMAARHAIFVVYHKLSRKLSRRFRPATPWETPLEWAHEAEKSLQLRDPQPLRRLAELYAQAKYSPAPLGPNEIEAARSAWAQLSWEQSRAQDVATPPQP